MSSLELSNGGESPARSAFALVFHPSDCSFVSPIKSVRGVHNGHSVIDSRGRGDSQGVERFDFLVTPVGEVVDAHLVGFTWKTVVVRDDLQVLGEVLKSLCVLEF